MHKKKFKFVLYTRVVMKIAACFPMYLPFADKQISEIIFALFFNELFW